MNYRELVDLLYEAVSRPETLILTAENEEEAKSLHWRLSQARSRELKLLEDLDYKSALDELEIRRRENRVFVGYDLPTRESEVTVSWKRPEDADALF